MFDVFYILSDGTKGSYRAPTSDLEKAISMARHELKSDFQADFRFTKVVPA